eukprot:TRINITY_DN14997_c0_g1_i1.p1 TRINITY_DN14997_c0_g1~~TRINITY_DN14997_c0_g1_i1.p1  ORF type:complete len:521 (-),score=102.08 TRINITY_DN14997_c0_g1_i1:20-1582(-)
MDLFPLFSGGGASPAITEIDANNEFQTYTYDDLVVLTTTFSRSLSTIFDASKRGLIGVVMYQNAESICALLACKSLNISTLLLPPSLRTDKNEPLPILNNARIKYLLSSPHTIHAWECKGIKIKTEVALPFISHPRFTLKLYEIETCNNNNTKDDEFFVSQPSIVQLTSGSTSSPKLAIRTWGAVKEEINADNKMININEGRNVVVVSALSHSYALIWSLVVLNNGGHLLVSSIHCSQFLKSFHVSFIFGIKATYEQLLQSSKEDPLIKEALKNVKFACCAGAPLDESMKNDFVHVFGLSIVQNYGSTETGSISLDKTGLKSISDSSSGFVLPHLEMSLLPLDEESNGKCGGCTKTCHGNFCDWKQNGNEFLLRGKAVAVGYLSLGKVIPCTDEKGWYHTRDVVEVKGEPASITILGRLRNPICISGNLINPESLQKKVVQTFTQGKEKVIQEAILFENSVCGVLLVLVVVTGKVLGMEDLMSWWKQNMDEYLWAIKVEIWDEKKLPKSPAGKLLLKYIS